MRSLCFSLWTSCSSRRYSPVQWPSSIPSTASNVDFPAPDGPMIVTKSPFATSSEIRRSTNCRPLPSGNDFSTSRTERKKSLFISQRDHRIDACRAAGREIARDKRHNAHQGCDGEVRDWIGGPHTVQRLCEEASCRDGGSDRSSDHTASRRPASRRVSVPVRTTRLIARPLQFQWVGGACSIGKNSSGRGSLERPKPRTSDTTPTT